MNVVELREKIVERPWTAMSVACAAGCITALGRRRGSRWAPLADMIATSMIPFVRELAARQLAGVTTR